MKYRDLFQWRPLAILAMATLAANTAWAEGEQRISGVVKPVVTIIKPSGRMGGSDMGGGHQDHGDQAGGGSAGSPPRMEDYNLPTKFSTPYAIASDSKGKIWFTEMTHHSIASLDPETGELKEYRIPSTEGLPDSEWEYDSDTKLTTPKSYNVYSVGNPAAMIIDKNDVIWTVTILGNSIVRFDPEKEEFTEYLIPTENTQPYDITADSKGGIWFIQKNAGKIGHLDVENEKMMEISLGHGANPMGITVDKDDKIWIGDVPGNYLGRYDPETKKLKMFPINVRNSQPGQMRFDSNGILWVCMLHSQQLGVLIPDPGVYSVAPLPGYNAVPQAVAPDSKGRIWVVDSMTNQVGFFDSIKLKWSIFDIPTANSQPMGITVDKAGDIWFTQSDRSANRITRLFAETVKEPAPAMARTASGSGVSEASGLPGGLMAGAVILLIVVGAGAFLVLRKGK